MVSLDRRLGRCRRRRFQIGRARQMAIAYHSRAVRRPSVLRAHTAVPVDDFTQRNSLLPFRAVCSERSSSLFLCRPNSCSSFLASSPYNSCNRHFLLFVLSGRDCFIFFLVFLFFSAFFLFIDVGRSVGFFSFALFFVPVVVGGDGGGGGVGCCCWWCCCFLGVS